MESAALDVPLQWDDLIADPFLQNLPFKIELNELGKIELSPAGNRHALLQSRIAAELAQRGGGVVLSEIAIRTSKGVRVADVAWMSASRFAPHADANFLPLAPEICVEIKSPSNTSAEMAMKVAAYLDAGADEVWVVTLDGERTVHRTAG